VGQFGHDGEIRQSHLPVVQIAVGGSDLFPARHYEGERMTDDVWARANQDFFANSPTPQPPAAQPAALSTDETSLLASSRLQSESRMRIGGVVPAGRRLKFGEALEVGLNLARSSWNVVTRAPGLLTVTALCLIVGDVLVLVYAELMGGFAAMESGGRLAVTIKDFPLLALLGVMGSMAQAVVVVVARDMFDNRRTSLVSAWGSAVAKFPQLAGFGVLYAAERTVTNMLRNTRGAKWAARALDYAWDFATYLAIPVIMFEPGVGPYSAVKRSGALVRTRFGVQLAATGAISLACFVCTIPLLIVAVMFGAMISTAAAIALAVLVLLTEMVVAATLQGVCSYVMYRFVTTGVVGGQFSETQLLRVFGTRPGMAGTAPAPA
jgi:hypothetical protein